MTAGNMFLMVVHSQQRGRQMPLVKHSYLFCPWKWLKSNKGILNKEKHDLMPSPVFFCLRRLCPPSLWGHDWRAVYSQSHTIGILSSGRTLQLRSGVRNPTKTRDAAKFILKKVRFTVGRSFWKDTETLPVLLFGFAGPGAHGCPLTGIQTVICTRSSLTHYKF